MDKMKKAMEEMRDSIRRANHVDGLVHKIESPFIASITSLPLPSKFKIPTWIHMMECGILVITFPRSR